MPRATIERVGKAEQPTQSRDTFYQLYQGFRDGKSYMLRVRAYESEGIQRYGLDILRNADWKTLHVISLPGEPLPTEPMVGSGIAEVEALAVKFLSVEWTVEAPEGRIAEHKKG